MKRKRKKEKVRRKKLGTRGVTTFSMPMRELAMPIRPKLFGATSNSTLNNANE